MNSFFGCPKNDHPKTNLQTFSAPFFFKVYHPVLEFVKILLVRLWAFSNPLYHWRKGRCTQN